MALKVDTVLNLCITLKQTQQTPTTMKAEEFLIQKGICPEKRIELVHGQNMLLIWE